MLKVLSEWNSVNKVIFVWLKLGVNEDLNVATWWFIYLGCNAHLVCTLIFTFGHFSHRIKLNVYCL